MTAKAWIQEAAERLSEAGVSEPLLDARLIAAHALGQGTSWLAAHPEAEVPAGADALLERRLAREPLAYIIGWREFLGHCYAVGPGVLVPRQETEVVVEFAAELIADLGLTQVQDLGCGSGCIGISLKLRDPGLQVTLTDISPDALSFARRNAGALEAQVEAREHDGPLPGMDAIVSNPPYVEADAELMPEVSKFEPRQALFAGSDGLDFYRRLAVEADAPLLVLELGDGQAECVSALFRDAGWPHQAKRQDLGGMTRALAVSRSVKLPQA